MGRAFKMNDTFSNGEAAAATTREYVNDWRKKMSDHVAWALIAYTGLHIFLTMGAMKETGMKSLALLALIILVAAIIPACRKFEKKWRDLSDEEGVDPAYESAFKRDRTLIWAMAIGLPFVLTAIFKAVAFFIQG